MSENMEQSENQCEVHPTNLDLHREQARQATLLEGLRDDVKEIKGVLVGDDRRDGMVLEVDRLKRSRAMFHAVLWVCFTAIVGTAATVIASFVQN